MRGARTARMLLGSVAAMTAWPAHAAEPVFLVVPETREGRPRYEVRVEVDGFTLSRLDARAPLPYATAWSGNLDEDDAPEVLVTFATADAGDLHLYEWTGRVLERQRVAPLPITAGARGDAGAATGAPLFWAAEAGLLQGRRDTDGTVTPERRYDFAAGTWQAFDGGSGASGVRGLIGRTLEQPAKGLRQLRRLFSDDGPD